MFRPEGWEQFYHYIESYSRFLKEIIKYPQLFIILIICLLALFFIGRQILKVLHKVGYSAQKEKENLKNPINILFYGIFIFLAFYLLISAFYYLCQILHIQLPAELVELQQELSK